MKSLLVVATLAALPLAVAARVQEDSATVKGRVVDAVSGLPLRDLTLNFNHRPRESSTPGIDPQAPHRSAVTDNAGGFEVASLMPGDYAIGASGQDPRYLPISYGVRRPGGGGTPLTVPENGRLDI